MLEIFVFIILLIFMVLIALSAARMKKNPDIKLCVPEGDEDIKIADGSFGDPLTNEDYADKAAAEYLKQKDVGNIEKAGQLGELLAKELWGVAQELLMKEEDQVTDRIVHQKILLYTYAVNSFVADSAPNSLLAETALSVFYSEVEELSKVLFQHISDTAAFSLYILNQRSGGVEEDIGRIYAKLSGKENDYKTIRDGNHLYNSFYNKCGRVYEEEITYVL